MWLVPAWRNLAHVTSYFNNKIIYKTGGNGFVQSMGPELKRRTGFDEVEAQNPFAAKSIWVSPPISGIFIIGPASVRTKRGSDSPTVNMPACSQSSVSIRNPIIFKRSISPQRDHQSKQESEQINRKVFSLSERPKLEIQRIYEATVHNYGFYSYINYYVTL